MWDLTYLLTACWNSEIFRLGLSDPIFLFKKIKSARYADINRTYGSILGYVGGNGNNKQIDKIGASFAWGKEEIGT
jgi:hypothetical protein